MPAIGGGGGRPPSPPRAAGYGLPGFAGRRQRFPGGVGRATEWAVARRPPPNLGATLIEFFHLSRPRAIPPATIPPATAPPTRRRGWPLGDPIRAPEAASDRHRWSGTRRAMSSSRPKLSEMVRSAAKEGEAVGGRWASPSRRVSEMFEGRVRKARLARHRATRRAGGSEDGSDIHDPGSELGALM